MACVYVMVFRENEVEYNEVYDITAVDHEFYPGAYEFYHELHNNPDKHRPAFETLLSHNRQYHRYNSEVLDSIWLFTEQKLNGCIGIISLQHLRMSLHLTVAQGAMGDNL